MGNMKLPGGWKVEKLGGLAVISAGQGAPQKESDYSDEGYPFVKASNLQFLCNRGSESVIPKISDCIAKQKKLRLYNEGTIIFAKSGMSCMKERVYTINGPCYIVNHLACVTPKSVNSKYLMYHLKRNPPTRLIKDMSYPSIRLSDIEDMDIMVPALETQKKIVEVLEKAEKALEKRKEANWLLDELVKSKFIEMFGDPVINSKGWDIKDLGTLGYFKNGMNYKQSDSGFNIKFLGVGEFKYGNKIDSSNMLPTLELQEEPNEEYLLKKGDIVFVRSNGSKELVGRSILVRELEEKTTYSGFCIRYRNQFEEVTTDFLIHLFADKSFKKSLKKDSRGANINNLNQQMLSSLKIIVPQLELQNEFVDFVKQVDKLKFEMQKSLEEMENNFNSLMQDAFNGKLEFKQ